ncbi:MAG: restriction endonuclease subunit M, partial [Rudanella sp.]|nr:restriction endonuclease subunit M [Rudanella sp.]
AQHDALTALSEQMQQLTGQWRQFLQQVADLLQTNLGIPKLTDKLLNWPALDWTGLLTELQKQKVGVSLPKQLEWKPFYEEQRAKVVALQTERTNTDRQIDQLVYVLYGLTVAEIALVEGVG